MDEDELSSPTITCSNPQLSRMFGLDLDLGYKLNQITEGPPTSTLEIRVEFLEDDSGCQETVQCVYLLLLSIRDGVSLPLSGLKLFKRARKAVYMGREFNKASST
ncbi:hypothetical protein C0Q70_07502 [Pomacea canaliculata]|uniref:Uncharacterized protein n=1 Tax=Pomacea canaliculata TaxID=400727 RepID=A0A2T7PF98_POMCA|nr:hypothetical protein C0Q70_07502 [Pomacea canaliculata]